jgi:hypothetical protein
MRVTLRASLTLAALLAVPAAALAQAPAPAEATPAPQAAVPAPDAASARAQCKAQIDGRSLTGQERHAAMRDCMKPQREACRSQAVAKGLPKGPDRKAFMHGCLHGKVAQTQ